MRSTLLWLSFILWILLAYYYYTSSNECCVNAITTSGDEKMGISKKEITADESAELPKNTEKIIKNKKGTLMAIWSSDSLVLSDDWNTKKIKLIEDIKENHVLEISGLYHKDETNKTNFENLGMARARKIARLFSESLQKDRLVLNGKMVDFDLDKLKPFSIAEFRNLIRTKNIKEVNDKTIIYFPFNSTNKLNQKEVENYLDDVAERVISSGEKIRLVGHTDAIASSKSNMKLGQKRADIIKNYLLSKGVSSDKIIAISKGEQDPIATNNTEVGKAQNRRTELRIIK